MNQKEKYGIVLIPSLEPDEKLPDYIKELKEYGLSHILVVDDGSGKKYEDIFHALEEDGCTVLRHQANLGKGSALKTGYKYIKENMSGYSCIVTADSDGQHVAEDVHRLAKEAGDQSDALILGVRDFKRAGIPFKSFVGNRVTSAVFAAVYGKYLPDTQTGLRAFGLRLVDQMIGIKGERFEYETQVLITCIRSKIPILTIPIQTVYENENKGTHFNAVKDSIKIMRMILSDFIKFFSSSILCSVIDVGAAWTLLDVLKPYMRGGDFLRIISATAAARCISITANYLLNKNMVFKDKQSGGHGLLRYLALCSLIMLLSAAGVYVMHTMLGLNEKVAKIICDTCLFVLSYQLQQRWVFRA